MMVVNSSRKSSTQRCTTQKRQKSVVVKCAFRLRQQPHGIETREWPGRRRRTARACCPCAPRQARPRRPRKKMTPRRTGRASVALARIARDPDTRSPDCRTSRSRCRIQPLNTRQTRPPGCRTTTIARAPSRRVGEHVLPARLAPGDHRRQEDARGQKRRRHPEDGQLQMPGARQVVWEQLRKVNTEKIRELGAVVLGAPPTRVCITKQQRHHQEELRGRPLRRRQRDLPGARSSDRCCSRPCQPRKFQRPKRPAKRRCRRAGR